MIDLSSKRYLVTGANTGVGRATAVELATRGAHVLLACRSAERARDALAAIEPLRGRGELIELDLADLASVRRCAALVDGTLDALIANAGVGGARGVTRQGFELAFGVNCLGHLLLIRLLESRISRVVHVSSGSHFRARGIDFDALARPTRTLSGVREYEVSKLCVMLIHHELSRRGVLSLAADPGDVASEAYRHVPQPVRCWMLRGMRAPSEGAKTSVFCATRDLPNGGFYVDEREQEPSALSRDERLAASLWVHCEAWLGLREPRPSATSRARTIDCGVPGWHPEPRR